MPNKTVVLDVLLDIKVMKVSRFCNGVTYFFVTAYEILLLLMTYLLKYSIIDFARCT